MNTKHEHEKHSSGSAAGTQRAPEQPLMHKESAKANRFVALVDLVRQNPNGDTELVITIKNAAHTKESVLPSKGGEYSITFEPYSAPR